MLDDVMSSKSPAARKKGTVNQSDSPTTLSRTVAVAVKSLSI
jgi:hypothetical protein